jgi:prophage regulatory protein
MITGKNEYLKSCSTGNNDSRLMHVNFLNHEGCDGEGELKKNLPVEIIFISMKKLVLKISKSRSWAYAAMNEKSPTYDELFPKPVRVGKRSICFVLSEVELWLQSRIAASRTIQ